MKYKYKYKDEVEIIKGFYKGCKGTVRIVTDDGLLFSKFNYLIHLDESIIHTEWIEEKYLKLQEKEE